MNGERSDGEFESAWGRHTASSWQEEFERTSFNDAWRRADEDQRRDRVETARRQAEQEVFHSGLESLDLAADSYFDQNYPKQERFEWKAPAVAAQAHLEAGEGKTEEEKERILLLAKHRLRSLYDHLHPSAPHPVDSSSLS